MKYRLDQLPGELEYRRFFNDLEIRTQKDYRAFQDWRMKLGIAMSDIDVLITDTQIESFGSMRNIETDMTNNYAILEMKHWRTKPSVIATLVKSDNPVKTLANSAKLPFYVVKYLPAVENNDQWEFTVYNANPLANQYLDEPKHMSEREYVEFLFSLRRQKPPTHIIQNCSEDKSDRLEMQPVVI